LGRVEDAVRALRRALALNAPPGEAWWSLSDLKTAKLTVADVEEMRRALTRPHAPNEEIMLRFALGKALADVGDDAGSFEEFRRANELQRSRLTYDADEVSSYVSAITALCTAEFFSARKDAGTTEHDPIFILGMPRSGSTLVEQILASHSSIEGTAELPDLLDLAASLEPSLKGLPQAIADLPHERLRQIGEAYIQRTRRYRQSGRPLFIDKMPNNWLHVALIILCLPNARIIDARRHPLACGYSIYRQYFLGGQDFSYDLGEIGRFYADYVRLMTHIDEVIPGRVHRIQHEQLLADPEGTTRALLDYLQVPFEQSCLDFHRTERTVRSASAMQVRQPLARVPSNSWRKVEPNLAPLRSALGPLADCCD
jgi:tetratricopeptide (TPR) repeat protein